MDQRTNGQMDEPTKRVVESRSRRLKRMSKDRANISFFYENKKSKFFIQKIYSSIFLSGLTQQSVF